MSSIECWRERRLLADSAAIDQRTVEVDGTVERRAVHACDAMHRFPTGTCRVDSMPGRRNRSSDVIAGTRADRCLAGVTLRTDAGTLR